MKKYLGGYSAEVPPLPIPNRVVKLSNADGTAHCGRVGSRHFQNPEDFSSGFFVFIRPPTMVGNNDFIL